jgi:hypothetical protein
MEDRVLFNIEQDTSNHPYVINLARDATRGRVANALDGRPNGGAPPYGYRVEYETVVVRGKRRRRPLRYVLGPPEEGDVVRWLFRTYAAGRTTLRRLAIDLNARGVASPKGAPRWGQGTIKKLLNNPVYLGQAVWNRRHEGKFFGVVDCKVEPSKKRQGTVLNPEGEWIRREGRHEPLIDRDTWEAVQRRLVENRKKPRPGRNGVFALAGLLVCGHCGRTMIGRTVKCHKKRSGKSYTYRRYTCGGYNTYGKSICSYNPIDEDRLLAVVISKLRQTFLAPDALDALRQEIRRQAEATNAGGPGGAESMRRRLADLEGQLRRGTRRMLAEEDDALVPGLRAELLSMQGEARPAAGRTGGPGAGPAARGRPGRIGRRGRGSAATPARRPRRRRRPRRAGRSTGDGIAPRAMVRPRAGGEGDPLPLRPRDHLHPPANQYKFVHRFRSRSVQPKWWASSWMTVLRISVRSRRGPGKSSSSGRL